jgi:hypothetical protein
VIGLWAQLRWPAGQRLQPEVLKEKLHGLPPTHCAAHLPAQFGRSRESSVWVDELLVDGFAPHPCCLIVVQRNPHHLTWFRSVAVGQGLTEHPAEAALSADKHRDTGGDSFVCHKSEALMSRRHDQHARLPEVLPEYFPACCVRARDDACRGRHQHSATMSVPTNIMRRSRSDTTNTWSPGLGFFARRPSHELDVYSSLPGTEASTVSNAQYVITAGTRMASHTPASS